MLCLPCAVQAVLDLWKMMQCMTDIPLSPIQGAVPAAIRRSKDTQHILVTKAIHYLESK